MNNFCTRDTSPGRSEAYWRTALLAGGFTALPCWSLDSTANHAEYAAAIPAELRGRLHRLAQECAVPLGTAFLAAHAKVMGTLCGECEIIVGYARQTGPPLPLQLTIAPRSWRDLLRETARTEAELLLHQDFPVDGLRRELGLDGPLFASLFGDAGGQADETTLGVSFGQEDLRLRYRTDRLDAAGAARIAAYHLRALSLIAADPDAAHARQSLLSTEELRFQLDDLAGVPRQLPGRRAHELFEAQVRAHPDAIAAVQGDRQLSYRQLNRRANRVARMLLANGLRREGVTAVVTERNLDWLCAVLAIFKAGGAYLPIEPHLPAERIAKMLARAECRIVLTEPGSTAQLDQALDAPGNIRRLLIDMADAQPLRDDDLGGEVAPDQLAYIYFTSGSTGEPKGAMCEHAGMLNHLLAKIGDLEIGRGSVVAQTAPQCFDISLWQLLAALLVGGQTRLIGQEAILDPARFVDEIAASRVSVLQLVPSYLEVVLARLERCPRALPDLRYVAVTGEALKKELTQRWFASQPRIRLVNVYGLTETSDDTNHEVMADVPGRDRVPLGRPIHNVHVYIVDEHLALVPLGAPGEIVFSGVCVGRGYVNDPERTRRAYLADPHRQGQRLYRSGDHGRWLPEGKLEFLGRKDAQVKLNGFRIEIGEIENALLQVAGVRDGAVVVAERADGGKQLVAFYSGAQPLAADVLRERLRTVLPGYMVPALLHWCRQLPLTDNGKIDRKALLTLGSALEEAAPARERASTATEQWLAGAWAEILALPTERIGRRDNFFELGGTSLSALRLAIRLNRALSVQELTEHPVLADLAGLIDARAGERPRAAPAGRR